MPVLSAQAVGEGRLIVRAIFLGEGNRPMSNQLVILPEPPRSLVQLRLHQTGAQRHEMAGGAEEEAL